MQVVLQNADETVAPNNHKFSVAAFTWDAVTAN